MSEQPPDLPDKTRRYLLYLANRLRQGYTGHFEIHCNQGGVIGFKEVRVVSSDEVCEPLDRAC